MSLCHVVDLANMRHLFRLPRLERCAAPEVRVEGPQPSHLRLQSSGGVDWLQWFFFVAALLPKGVVPHVGKPIDGPRHISQNGGAEMPGLFSTAIRGIRGARKSSYKRG